MAADFMWLLIINFLKKLEESKTFQWKLLIPGEKKKFFFYLSFRKKQSRDFGH